ncbi:MAG TPA: hypothetical protein VFK04_17575 [Gemmatimonadaceae bacterium]|jgi:hypothetical protein|nr:hypothetical protein [Gemmatimonadaceae bacterium]
MRELIHKHSSLVRGDDERTYEAFIYGQQRVDGTWIGWIEFVPLEGGSVLRTTRETSQPDRDALVYWAGGLEPLYLEGAMERAWP